MPNGAQSKQDFIGRTGTHATRFSVRQYQDDYAEVMNWSEEGPDPERMSLIEMRAEQESLLLKAKAAETLIHKLKQANESTRAQEVAKRRHRITGDLAVLKNAIKRENIRLHSASETMCLRQAILDVVGEADYNRIVLRKIALEDKMGDMRNHPDAAQALRDVLAAEKPAR